VAHPIPPWATTAGASLGARRRGKGPLEIARTPDMSAEDSDEGTNVDAYLNTTMFMTQSVRILLIPI
jgi:hypothetical protein